MGYSIRFQSVNDAVKNYYEYSLILNECRVRLNNIAANMNYLQSNTRGKSFSTHVKSRSSNVGAAAINLRRCGQVLDNSRIEYLLSEQLVYQNTSGDDSFNIGDGISIVPVPDFTGKERGSVFEDIKDRIGKATKAAIEDVTAWWNRETSPGGFIYKGVNVGLAVLGIATGAVQAISGALMFGTIAGAPLGALLAIYGINDFFNGFNDLKYTISGEYYQVGRNALAECIANGYWNIGSWIGQEDGGELFGNVVYGIGGMVGSGTSFIYSFSDLFTSKNTIHGIWNAINSISDYKSWGDSSFSYIKNLFELTQRPYK